MTKPELSLVVIDPLTEVQTVQINVGQGTIWCTPNAGALRVPPRSVVYWKCSHPFTIGFQQLGGTSAPLPTLPSSGPANDVQSVQLRPSPVAETAQAPYYEYTVTVGDLVVDPIIIVDKH
jgi:hypothetical protein